MLVVRHLAHFRVNFTFPGSGVFFAGWPELYLILFLIFTQSLLKPHIHRPSEALTCRPFADNTR